MGIACSRVLRELRGELLEGGSGSDELAGFLFGDAEGVEQVGPLRMLRICGEGLAVGSGCVGKPPTRVESFGSEERGSFGERAVGELGQLFGEGVDRGVQQFVAGCVRRGMARIEFGEAEECEQLFLFSLAQRCGLSRTPRSSIRASSKRASWNRQMPR